MIGVKNPEFRETKGTLGLTKEYKCQVCGAWKRFSLTAVHQGGGIYLWTCRRCMGLPSIEK